MAELGRLNMTKPDILMSALINCNNNYRDKTPTVLKIKQKLKNVTPKKEFTQLELNFKGSENE